MVKPMFIIKRSTMFWMCVCVCVRGKWGVGSTELPKNVGATSKC